MEIIFGIVFFLLIVRLLNNSGKRTNYTYYKKNKSYYKKQYKHVEINYHKQTSRQYSSTQTNNYEIDENKLKGDKFERYMVKLIDSSSDKYKLLHWRSDKIAENGIYAESNKYPDLEYLYKDDSKSYRFAVECKWRNSFYNGAIKWSEPKQIQNYLEFERETQTKVFIAIGVGGTPENPEQLYVTTLQNLQNYPNVFESYLRKFRKNTTQKFNYNQK